jgi:hypothetical protein
MVIRLVARRGQERVGSGLKIPTFKSRLGESCFRMNGAFEVIVAAKVTTLTTRDLMQAFKLPHPFL